MAKSIMIQGTMSNAGKSLLTAGLCRIFVQDGYKVAPFKSQNMALNSFITEDGLEMGRAQVIQAEAGKIKPSVSMNPILLKPTNDTGSQVIVNGQVMGNMSAREYFKYKKKLVPQIMKAYHELEKNHDIIVIEGAGSPAEINLKTEDIVNMGMAKMAKSPVLLVGDIDRGGVFAQLIGTLHLLEEDEKQMVKGLIINKFRGDKSILEPGVIMLENRAEVSVVGVTPYMNVDIEDEDSLTERFSKTKTVDQIDIAVIRLPRISNFTDFNVFESIEGVSLRYIKAIKELGNPDMIILPGTKNTMKDLQWLRESGLEAAILKEAHKGKVIFGVCGGYQMLGETLSDPEGVEEGGFMKEMSLLPMDTVFQGDKIRSRVKGEFQQVDGILKELSGVSLSGYEIHMGVSEKKGDSSLLTSYLTQIKPESGSKAESDTANTDKVIKLSTEPKLDGMAKGNIYGSYVHGIFDKEQVVKTIISSLAKEKGIHMNEINTMDYEKYKEIQYDILADTLRQHLDMKKIYNILEEGI